MQKAGAMLKAEKFQLFAEVKDDSLVGIVKSQSNKDLVYSCRLGADGAFRHLGRLDEATQAYQKSLEIKPTFTYSLYELGIVYSQQGRNQEAIDFFRKVLEVEPRHIYANHALGLMYDVVGNKTGAMQQYYILKDLSKDDYFLSD